MFPLRLRHDAEGAPVATVLLAEAVTAADASRHWCQLAAYWAAQARLPCYMSDAPPQADPNVPSRAGVGSLYVLWSAQLIGQVDADTIAAFKQAATGFRPVAAPAANDAALTSPLYCRYLLVRRSDGGLISGNAAREIIGWAPLPPLPAGAPPLSADAARDREIAHDDAQFLVRARVETHMSLAARLPGYFVCVRVASRYFSLRFGAPVIAVGVPQQQTHDDQAAPFPPPSAAASSGSSVPAPTVGFLAAEEDPGITLVTVAVPNGGGGDGGGGGWLVQEEAPAHAETALANAGFFTQEGTNAASIELPMAEVVALLTSWGWVQLAVDDVA